MAVVSRENGGPVPHKESALHTSLHNVRPMFFFIEHCPDSPGLENGGRTFEWIAVVG